MEKFFGNIVTLVGILVLTLALSPVYGVLAWTNNPRGSSIIMGIMFVALGTFFNRILAVRMDPDQAKVIRRFQGLLGALMAGMASNALFFMYVRPYPVGWLNDNNAGFSGAIAIGALAWAILMIREEQRIRAQQVPAGESITLSSSDRHA